MPEGFISISPGLDRGINGEKIYEAKSGHLNANAGDPVLNNGETLSDRLYVFSP